MSREIPAQALARWAEILGPANVLTADAVRTAYTDNVSGLDRDVPAVLKPASTTEVQAVVRVANEFKTPLHPISCGRNLGLGSKLPVQGGTVIVDLARMNRIHEVNVEGRFAVVEPGVTQGQLYEHLQASGAPLILNVTGAGSRTSVIGNALERGIGYFSSRADALSGLEVVLGHGEILRTGFGHYPGAKTTHLYRYGIGPMLDGLFAQSGLGIVTTAGVDLLPRPEGHRAVVMKIADEARLEEFIDALADLRSRDVIRTVVHVADRSRSTISVAPLLAEYLAEHEGRTPLEMRERAEQGLTAAGFGPWSAMVGIMGSTAQLALTCREIKSRLAGIAKVEVLSDARLRNAKRMGRYLRWLPGVGARLALLHAVEPVYGLSKGIPTDAPLRSLYWPVGETWSGEELDPDHGRSGMLYFLPFLPMTGRDARQVVDGTRDIFSRHGFEASMTLNLVDAKAFEAVISLAFDRSKPERLDAAHTCMDELRAQCLAWGYLPYRVGIQGMKHMVDGDDPFWRTVKDLKRVLDPNNIISPGRYCPDD